MNIEHLVGKRIGFHTEEGKDATLRMLHALGAKWMGGSSFLDCSQANDTYVGGYVIVRDTASGYRGLRGHLSAGYDIYFYMEDAL